MQWPIDKNRINPYLYSMEQVKPHFFGLRQLLVIAFVLMQISGLVYGQTNDDQDDRVIQISGKVVTEDDGKIMFLPYAVVAVKGTNRGTYTDFSGFFSIVVRPKETLVFSVLGYKDAFYTVPDGLDQDRYTIFQVMSKDTFLLPEAVIYPWPDPTFFTQEFLAMDVHDDLEDLAKENLSEKSMAALREYLPSDGVEHTSLYLKQQSQSYYYEGQIRPINLFNAFAWKEFIQAWKRGDFKKKDNK
jgi:hypothetical protein